MTIKGIAPREGCDRARASEDTGQSTQPTAGGWWAASGRIEDDRDKRQWSSNRTSLINDALNAVATVCAAFAERRLPAAPAGRPRGGPDRRDCCPRVDFLPPSPIRIVKRETTDFLRGGADAWAPCRHTSGHQARSAHRTTTGKRAGWAAEPVRGQCGGNRHPPPWV